MIGFGVIGIEPSDCGTTELVNSSDVDGKLCVDKSMAGDRLPR
jgi:hypothetical protein